MTRPNQYPRQADDGLREARLDAIHALARRESVTLPGLCRQMSLSRTVIWSLLQSLLRRGLIQRCGHTDSQGGRPATTFRAVGA
ncbi:MarR family transcriptional regulator [Deinococcus multiflagellatus]|uniref:MarR family transcriptional regulator n=1 Tax=Deinococcus multiflagellatus TaxID=1656887 RepID=A0ABW1ZRD4_9DEIO|nr:hypothetical protein [Deinococcus multiflagellatus]MBZ9715343.1 hypothetical protein [Deinococcus multiflagellatus]